MVCSSIPTHSVCLFRLDIRRCSGGGKCARIECIECHECSRERVHGTKWRELWMRIEEKSDSYRQEGTASLIRFLERSRPLVKKGGKMHTSTPRVFCTNWMHRMSRMQSRASAWDQVTRICILSTTKCFRRKLKFFGKKTYVASILYASRLLTRIAFTSRSKREQTI